MRSCHSGMMRAYKAVLLLKVILEISCLLRLLVESGDMVLKEHLCSAPNISHLQFKMTSLMLQVNGYKKKSTRSKSS